MNAIIVNYNQHEAADRLREWVGDCIVVDNGSAVPYPGADVRLEENRDTIGGVLAGLEEAKRRGARYYWLLSTSMSPIGSDPIPAMLDAFDSPDVVGVSPLWIGDIRSPAHAHATRAGRARILNTFSAWRADWLDSISWFDPRLTTGWGTDFETSYLARDRTLLVIDKVKVEIHETAHNGRADFARHEMNTILTEKYGDWKKVLCTGL